MNLAKVGLHRPELRAWASYDWAISGLQTTIQTAVFPIYFVSVAASHLEGPAALQLLARANTVAMIAVALLAPLLGAIADYSSAKKRFLAFFTIVGAVACIGMFWIHQGDATRAALLFVVSIAAGAACMVFYDGLLPGVARSDEMDRVSTAAYGIGYLGGGLLLALNLLWIQKPEWFGLRDAAHASRVTFVSVGVWWLLFAIPLFRGAPEPPRRLEKDETPDMMPVRVAVRRLRETLGEFRGYRQAFLMLIAFLIYNDGTQTIIKMATAYGKEEMGLATDVLIGAVVLVQFIGVPFAFLFGRIGTRIGAKRAIFICLGAYTTISLLGYFMTTATHFVVLAVLVGMVQGGTQALSRSLFASMIPRHKSGEFFGFYSVFEKFAGIFGPLLFDLAITVTGSSRSAILSVIAFFVIGGVLLARVNVTEGQAIARRREAELTQSLT
jgi:MFS transporter, UMF1 family